MSLGSTFTKTYHRKPYPAISPTRPEVSQAGRTVLIIGGSEGVGLAIAKACLQASAARVIISARRRARLDAAAAELADTIPGCRDRVSIAVCDVGDVSDGSALWDRLAAEGVVVDVLFLNAARFPGPQTILDRGTEEVWKDYEVNARAQLYFAERFYKQRRHSGVSGPKYLVHTSTFSIHEWNVAGEMPAYGLTKNAGVAILQQIAKDVGPEKMQIVSFNPGPVFTAAARAHGYTEDTMPWNDAALPGQFALWLASPEARFLHGRFVWTEWDVEELQSGEIRKRIDEDPYYLKVGVVGL